MGRQGCGRFIHSFLKLANVCIGLRKTRDELVEALAAINQTRKKSENTDVYQSDLYELESKMVAQKADLVILD